MKRVDTSRGRVDIATARAFQTLLNRYGNPQLRLACRLLSGEIQECFTENLGPGTKAHQVGQRLLRVVGEKP